MKLRIVITQKKTRQTDITHLTLQATAEYCLWTPGMYMLCYKTCQKYIPQLCCVLDCLKRIGKLIVGCRRVSLTWFTVWFLNTELLRSVVSHNWFCCTNFCVSVLIFCEC